jgi:hypothetical protein
MSRKGQALAESFSPARVAAKLIELYSRITRSSTPERQIA